MKKNLLFIIVLCSLLPCVAQAQLNNGYILVDGDSPSSYCLPEKQTLTLTVSPDLLDRGDLEYFSWILLGDLELADGSTNRDATITIRSNGYGKGVVRLAYNTGNCTSSTEIEIFKQFNPADVVPYPEILGPECISAGDTVVYSVNPLLTVNLYDRIGIDNYYWNITDENKPAFVDRVLYTSGDGSSVTFIVGEVTNDAMLSVQIGRCNAEWPVTRTLSKAAPAPVVPEMVCLPYDEESVVLEVENAQAGVFYRWTLPDNRWSVDYMGNSVGNKVTILMPAGATGEVYVTAFYESGEACSNSVSTVVVNRSWGKDVNISVTPSDCVSTGEDIVLYLQGNIPANSQITWTIPQGWVLNPLYDEHNVRLYVTPVNTTSLVDTFRVSSPSCNDKGVDEAVKVVYVKPTDVTIEGEQCVEAGKTYTYSAVPAGKGPMPASYRWTLNGVELQGKGNTVDITAQADTLTLTVQPIGLSDCNGTVASKRISYRPSAPTGIEIEGDKCIAYNMPDTVTFALEGTVAYQSYEWVIPESWKLYETDEYGTTATIITNGVAGTYTVEAYGAGEGTCGQSEIVSRQVEIPLSGLYVNLQYSIGPSTLYELVDSIGPMPSIKTAEWYLFKDGQPITDVLFGSGANAAAIANPGHGVDEALGDLTGSKVYTIVVYVTFTDGCKVRIIYGAPLNDDVLNGQMRRQISVKSSTPILRLTPNPTQGDLQINIDGLNGIADIAIINLQGQVVMQNNSFSIGDTCDTSALPIGQYIVSVQQEGERYMGLFIKK